MAASSVSNMPQQAAVGECNGHADWMLWRGNCYFFMPDAFVNWKEAERKCSELWPEVSSHLASVLSEQEKRVLVMAMRRRTRLPLHRWFWLGYSSPDWLTRGVWSDRKYTGYAHVSLSSLSQFGDVDLVNQNNVYEKADEGRKCLATDTFTGQWSLTNCDGMHGYACKAPAQWADKPVTMSTTPLMTSHSARGSTGRVLNVGTMTSPTHFRNSTHGGTSARQTTLKRWTVVLMVVSLVFLLVGAVCAAVLAVRYHLLSRSRSFSRKLYHANQAARPSQCQIIARDQFAVE